MEALTTAVSGAMSIFTTNGASLITFIEGQELILVGVGMTIVGWVFGKVFSAIRGL